MPQRWYVATTHPKAEAFAADNLKNQSFECFLPLREECKIVRHKSVQTSLPLFPSYIFVQFDAQAQRWRSVNGTRGIQRLICHGDSPMPLKAGVVEELQERALSGEFSARGDTPKTPRFRPGEDVVVTGGPFFGHGGICKLSNHQRVSILLTLFGREMEMSFRPDQLRAA